MIVIIAPPLSLTTRCADLATTKPNAIMVGPEQTPCKNGSFLSHEDACVHSALQLGERYISNPEHPIQLLTPRDWLDPLENIRIWPVMCHGFLNSSLWSLPRSLFNPILAQGDSTFRTSELSEKIPRPFDFTWFRGIRLVPKDTLLHDNGLENRDRCPS